MDLTGKTIWITGASSGIGAGLATGFARAGARLVLSGRREEALAEVAGRLPTIKAAGIVATVPLRDVAIEPDTKSLLAIERVKHSDQLARFVEDPQRDQSLPWHSEGDLLRIARSRLQQRNSKNKCEHEGA
jgi:NAD(P)-dependent dehydrogenase (short-subunit alcohol dehydrogenase family)